MATYVPAHFKYSVIGIGIGEIGRISGSSGSGDCRSRYINWN